MMRALVFSILLLAGADLCAQVYKCKRGNVIAYQDKPCAKGTQIGRITVAPAQGVFTGPQARPRSVAPPAAAAQSVQTLAPKAPASLPNAPAAQTTVAALPDANNYLCVRFDGTKYYSASKMPNRYYVKASQMAVAPKDLKPAQNVWVTDNCKPAPLTDACAHYASEIDQVQAKLAGAPAGQVKALEREARRLRTISNSRCRNL
jgi:hypothetical protein